MANSLCCLGKQIPFVVRIIRRRACSVWAKLWVGDW